MADQDQRDRRGERAGLRVLGNQLSTGQLVVLVGGLVVLGGLGVLWAVAPTFTGGDDNAIATTRTGILVVGAATIAAMGAGLSLIETQRANREADQRERYSKAIDQLGHRSVDVRLGGIYTLQRIAEDSDRYHATVVEVLSAFVRGHGQRGAEAGGHPSTVVELLSAFVRGQGQKPVVEDNEVRDRYRPLDEVLAALRVIGRVHALDNRLHADLERAHLEDARLPGAQLTGANPRYAYLTDAHLHQGDLTDATLIGANLTGADLTGADLTGADLTGAVIGGVEGLKEDQLSVARGDEKTTLPGDVQRPRHWKLSDAFEMARAEDERRRQETAQS